MNVVHELASGIRDTVECTYDQIWNIFESLASVGLAQARPNDYRLDRTLTVEIIISRIYVCVLLGVCSCTPVLYQPYGCLSQ